MKNNEFEFIKEKFNNSQVDIPKGLETEAIKEKILLNQKHNTIKFQSHNNNHRITQIVAFAACFALIIIASAIFYPKSDVNNFKSYDELNSLLSQSTPPEMGCYSGGAIKGLDDADEPYSVMSDGDYIYYAYSNSNYDYNSSNNSYGKNIIYIYKAEDENATLINTINNVFADDYDLYDLYVKNGRLVVCADNYSTGLTETKVFDVSDPSDPKIISDTEQSGSKLRSFFVGDTAYIFTSFTVTDTQNAVPVYIQNGETKIIDSHDIYYFDNTKSSQYIVVTAIDMQSANMLKDIKAVFGAGYLIDCVGNDVFISDNDESKDIIKISMNGKNIRLHSAEINEIPRFDTNENLVEVSENKYLSINFEDADNGNIVTLYEAVNGQLKELDRIELENVYANAADNYNDIIACDGYYLLPCYFSTPEKRVYGAITIEITNDKINITNEFKNEDKDAMYQGDSIAINNYIYSFNINDFEPDDKKLRVFGYKY